ncbi:hypothetical protein FB451DRAFT_1430993, partial [Mycena latifolia]
EHRMKILDRLSPIKFFQQQEDIAQVRVPGTGEWFLAKQRFQQWEAGSGGKLWCRGIPGAGKTVIASMTVEHLMAKSNAQNTGVAWIYLNHKETEAQTPSNLLASIWRQLVVHKSIGSFALELYHQHSEKGTRPSEHEIQQLLRCTLTEYSKVYVIVDALDEYPDEQRHILCKHLVAMGPTVNLMLTSRPHIYLGDEAVDIYAQDDDVWRYVDEQIKISPQLSNHVKAEPGIRQSILSISSRANGM